jgi:hypothetical protein
MIGYLALGLSWEARGSHFVRLVQQPVQTQFWRVQLSLARIREVTRPWRERPKGAFLIAAGSFVLGAALSVWPPEIRDATRRFFYGPRGDVEWLVLAFWTVALLWTRALWNRLHADEEHETAQQAGLQSAIWRAPNPQVLTDYPTYYAAAAEVITRLGDVDDPGTRFDELEKAIQAVLTYIIGIAKQFSSIRPTTAVYGANVMLIARPDDEPHDFVERLVGVLRFHDKEGSGLQGLQAILYMPPGLTARLATAAPYAGPVIALPVPRRGRTPEGYAIALPGAPQALLGGATSVYEDTRRISEYCQDFSAPIRSSVQRYFSEDGDGKHIRSFASFRLGDSRVPAGVLNIDSSDTHLLGPDKSFYPTFYALITPFLWLLAKPARAYARMLVKNSETALLFAGNKLETQTAEKAGDSSASGETPNE